MGYKVDVYGGIILDPSSLPNDIESFRCIFENTLTHLKQIGFQKGFWMRIPLNKIEFVPVCVKEFDFSLHHARCDYVMLVKWAHPSQPNPIPRQSSHQAGIASIVLRGDGSILLVKEVVGPAAAGGGIWKLPTGLVEPVEDLFEAAIREVHEEVGINCTIFSNSFVYLFVGEFDSIVALRHSHGGSPELGASSDILFVCLLKPKDELQDLVLQASEIAEAIWVHHSQIDKLANCEPGTSAGELMKIVREVASGENQLRIRGIKLPAWRRKNCDQWIFKPTDMRANTE